MPAAPDTLRLREITELLERLHRHKDAAYGDAWRKRGEVIAIFANMARKYDRLLVALTSSGQLPLNGSATQSPTFVFTQAST